METEEYSYPREAIKNAINTFVDQVYLGKKHIPTDEEFEKIMQAPDIQDRINDEDHIMNFEDGLAIGISVGYRMGASHTVTIIHEQAETEAEYT